MIYALCVALGFVLGYTARWWLKYKPAPAPAPKTLAQLEADLAHAQHLVRTYEAAVNGTRRRDHHEHYLRLAVTQDELVADLQWRISQMKARDATPAAASPPAGA